MHKYIGRNNNYFKQIKGFTFRNLVNGHMYSWNYDINSAIDNKSHNRRRPPGVKSAIIIIIVFIIISCSRYGTYLH